MKKIYKFLSENFHFLVAKFSVYLSRHVFIMKLPSYEEQFNLGIHCYSSLSIKSDPELRSQMTQPSAYIITNFLS